MTWSDWPARRQPGRAVLAGIVVLGSVGWAASLDGWMGLVAALLLLGATGEVLLPTRFDLDSEGVSVRHPFRVGRRDWGRFGSWRATQEGFLLRGRSASTWLQRRRALMLRCPGREAAVASLLQAHLGAPEAR
jgi:hypothetical protein